MTIAKSMNPTRLNEAIARTDPWTVVPYQSTHNTGGAIMGTDPAQQRAQQVSAELGLPQPVRGGRERVSAQLGLQPDRAGWGARLLDRGCHQDRYVKNPEMLV